MQLAYHSINILFHKPYSTRKVFSKVSLIKKNILYYKDQRNRRIKHLIASSQQKLQIAYHHSVRSDAIAQL